MLLYRLTYGLHYVHFCQGRKHRHPCSFPWIKTKSWRNHYGIGKRSSYPSRYETYTGEVWNPQLCITGFTLLILHPGNSPVIRYSRGRSGHVNSGSIFSEIRPKLTERRRKVVHSGVPRRGDFLRHCSAVGPSSLIGSDLSSGPRISNLQVSLVKYTNRGDTSLTKRDTRRLVDSSHSNKKISFCKLVFNQIFLSVQDRLKSFDTQITDLSTVLLSRLSRNIHKSFSSDGPTPTFI